MGMIQLPPKSIEFFTSNLGEIFETGSLAEGIWSERLSGLAKTYCGVACATPTVSNGSGLMALLQIYKENDGRVNVLLQSNTMYGVKTLVKSAGLSVCGYIDCDPSTLMPGLTSVQESLEGVKDRSGLVVLLSHIGGIINPAIREIARCCKAHNVVLLEDCAHSFGATLQGKHSGTFGDAGVFSFYATKAIPAGEGGVAVTNDRAIGAVLDDYVKYDRFNRALQIGVNIRPSEVQALLIFSVAKEADEIIRNKSEIASVYRDVCSELSIPIIRQDRNGNLGNYYKFIVLSAQGDIATDLPALRTTTSKVYDYCLGDTKIVAANHACLPIWYNQPRSLTDRVVEELRQCRGRRKPK